MKTKHTGLRIWIDRELREAFEVACRGHDKPAAPVLREFMQRNVKKKAPPPAEARQAAT